MSDTATHEILLLLLGTIAAVAFLMRFPKTGMTIGGTTALIITFGWTTVLIGSLATFAALSAIGLALKDECTVCSGTGSAVPGSVLLTDLGPDDHLCADHQKRLKKINELEQLLLA